MKHLAVLTLLVWGVTACSVGVPTPSSPSPIAWVDTLPIVEPQSRDVLELPRLIRTSMSGEFSDALGLRAITRKHHEALNTNHFDDVENSAWFVHRNGRQKLTPEEVFRGPTTSEGPAAGRLTIVAAKVQGISPGYTIRDSEGDRYVVKFDPKGFLYLSSGAGVISNRLLHAAGFNVPEDYIFRFETDLLDVDPEATVTDEDFIEQPLTLQVARDALARTDSLPDGRFVSVASKFVPGPPKGPFFFEGVRADDPNDHYVHESRRELRGLSIVSSWINHVDMRFMNTMDAYVSPGFLRHYLIDFAATLGSGTIRPHEPREGLEYNFDFWDTMGRVFTLGFHNAGWEKTEWEPIHPTIGWMAAEDFNPAQWKPNWPNEAFNSATDRDAYWGAKLVGSFDEAQIRAAVAAGSLPDAWAADTLVDILIVRRAKIVEYWYSRVSPIETLALGTSAAGESGLLFEDLGIRDRAWTAQQTSYAWQFEDPATGVRQSGSLGATGPGAGQRLMIPDLAGDSARPPQTDERYATVEVLVERDGHASPRPAVVYLRWTGETYQVVGLMH
jgi:hypothetical protein